MNTLKKLNVVLQYTPAVIAFIFALSLWRAGSNTSAALLGLIGIGLMLLSVLLNTIRKIVGNDRRLMIVLAIVVFFCSLYLGIKGEIYYGLIAILSGIFMILGHLLHSQRQMESKWSSSMWQIYIPVAAGLITFGPLLYLQYKKNNSPTVENAVGLQQQNIEKSSTPNKVAKARTSTAKVSPRMEKMVDIINQNLTPEQRADPTFQKLMEIMASKSFQEQLKQQTPKAPQEILQLLAANGLTEAAEIDFDKILAEGQQRLEKAYKARNPGKDPAKEDDAMADRFAESMKLHGPIGGMAQFMRDTENVEWINFRFKDDQEAYNAWKNQVRRRFEMGIARVNSESEERASQALASTGVESIPPLQQEIPIGESTAQDTSVELEAPIIPDTADLAKTSPVVEPEKVVTQVSPSAPVLPTDEELETTLSERFSSGRIEQAMSTLERYGPKEGLRHLRESDPEIASQIQQRRDKEDSEEDY